MEHIKRGWLLSNYENGNIVIQKCDESDRFKSDDEATEFVVKSYNELLEACKKVYLSLQERGEVNLILARAIAKAEGGIKWN